MSNAIRIAAAQAAAGFDAAANLVRISALMRQAKDQGARLVQFHEGAMSGYTSGPGKIHFKGWNVDWHALRDALEAVGKLARELGIWVVIGSNHELTPPNRPHNSLYVISDEGRLVARYDKRMCSNSEINDWYTPGREPVLFEVDGFTFGCALCIEVQFPELFIEYGKLGADAVLFSSFGSNETFDLLLQAHAATNNLWVSLAVPTQLSGNGPAGVIGPNGRWIQRCSPDADALCVVDLDRDAPDLHEAVHLAKPWRAKARVGEIYRERLVTDPRSEQRTAF